MLFSVYSLVPTPVEELLNYMWTMLCCFHSCLFLLISKMEEVLCSAVPIYLFTDGSSVNLWSDFEHSFFIWKGIPLWWSHHPQIRIWRGYPIYIEEILKLRQFNFVRSLISMTIVERFWKFLVIFEDKRLRANISTKIGKNRLQT